MQPTPFTASRVGAPSAAAAGATGRVTATPVSPPSATVSVSSTPKPATIATSSAAASPAAATAPDGTLLLSAPLGLQATVLSQPSFYPSLGEDLGDFTEEGDILFAVLGDPWSRVRCGTPAPAPHAVVPVADDSNEDGDGGAESAGGAVSHLLMSSLSSSTALCVQPVLTLPRKVGVSLACETFRALLSFHNAATYALTQAHLNVGVTQPPAPLRRALLRRTVASLPPKSNYTVVAAVPLHDASTYSLAVAVDYSDPSGRQRQLTWNSTLKIEQPIMETQTRRLTYVKPPTLPQSRGKVKAVMPPPSRGYAQYRLSVGLKNMSSVPLFLIAAELLLPTLTHHSGRPLFANLTPSTAQHVSHVSHSSGGADLGHAPPPPPPSSAPVFLTPGDTQTFVFDIGVSADELRHATVVHGQGGTTTRLLSPRLTSFGHVQWSWCRANGEAGTARSAPLRVGQLIAEPEVVLTVSGVSPTPTEDKSSQEEGEDSVHVEEASGVARVPPRRLLLAGSRVTIQLVLVNHSSVHRYDVALKVRVERLAPQWLYTGPTVRLLGPLEAAGSLAFSLTLLPWQAGWLTIDQSALEIVDAVMPEAVLWPPASASLLQPVDGHNMGITSAATSASAAGTDGDRPVFVATLPAVMAQGAMQAALPGGGDALCEVLVL